MDNTNNNNNHKNECHLDNCHVDNENNNGIENQNELQNDNKIKELKDIINSQEKNIAYLKADIENIRRNNYKEIQQNVNRQAHKIVMNFLSVIDDYERSLEFAKTLNQKELYDGLMLTYNAFTKVLQDLDVQEIDCKGEFNPEFHDAISTHVDSSLESNSIYSIVQKGFLYKNQVMRPAKVIIVS